MTRVSCGEGLRALLVALVLLCAGAARADQDTYLDSERGRALATAGDCIACHTAPNRPPFSGGRGLETPFGTINSASHRGERLSAECRV